MTDLEIQLIQHWYGRFEAEKLIKVLVVHGMQTCIRINYLGQLPNWFNKKVKVTDSAKHVDEYFSIAQNLAATMRLGESDMAGLLLDPRRVDPSKKLTSNDFVSYSVVKARSAFFPGMFPSVFDMLNMVESNVTSTPSTQPGEEFGKGIHCQAVFDILKEKIHDILAGKWDHILEAYGGSARATALPNPSAAIAKVAAAAKAVVRVLPVQQPVVPPRPVARPSPVATPKPVVPPRPVARPAPVVAPKSFMPTAFVKSPVVAPTSNMPSARPTPITKGGILNDPVKRAAAKAQIMAARDMILAQMDKTKLRKSQFGW
jgi:hypothetical protein